MGEKRHAIIDCMAATAPAVQRHSGIAHEARMEGMAGEVGGRGGYGRGEKSACGAGGRSDHTGEAASRGGVLAGKGLHAVRVECLQRHQVEWLVDW